jgi:hypothetical protein
VGAFVLIDPVGCEDGGGALKEEKDQGLWSRSEDVREEKEEAVVG